MPMPHSRACFLSGGAVGTERAGVADWPVPQAQSLAVLAKKQVGLRQQCGIGRQLLHCDFAD